jgi:hypothetical protein
MRSILPPDLEAKRAAIARKHNRLVAVLFLVLVALSVVILLIIAQIPRGHRTPGLVAYFVVIGATEVYGLYRIFQYDKVMCRRLGFMCPHCAKPLYEPRGFIWVDAKCPKCKKSILG